VDWAEIIEQRGGQIHWSIRDTLYPQEGVVLQMMLPDYSAWSLSCPDAIGQRF
jgi:hypothetical protein